MITDNTAKWKAVKLTEFAGKSFPVGFMHFSLEKEVPAGELPASGYLYNRTLYTDLWNWANKRGLVISESEWQAIANANNGNCAYYSDGDGSTTFRVPSIKCWVKGANSVEEVGNYLEAGLPNLGGQYTVDQYASSTYSQNSNGSDAITTGVFTTKPSKAMGNYMVTYISGNGRPLEDIAIDASRCSSVYRDDIDTVQPPSLVGMWLIVAFGVAHNIGEADVANVMQAVEQVQTGLGAIDGISDYIIESYRNGTEWYEVYKSGKVRQGGFYISSKFTSATITLLKEMVDTSYHIEVTWVTNWADAVLTNITKNTNNFVLEFYDGTISFYWTVEGQGA